MKIISQTVNQYLLFTKIVNTVEQHGDCIVEKKQVFVLGLKMYEGSNCREYGIADEVKRVWSGSIN